MELIRIALRNLSRQKKRSFILGGAIAFGFLIVIMADGLLTGVLSSIEGQMIRLVGGQIMISGAVKAADKKAEDKASMVLSDADIALISQTIKTIGLKPDRMLPRTSSNGGTLIFNGRKNISAVSGVDFEKEAYLQKTILLKAGNWETILQNPNSIVFSESIAEELQILLGDTVFYSTETVKGQKTVGEFILTGITTTQGPFGQISAYAHKKALNALFELESDGSTEYMLFFENNNKIEGYANAIESELKKYAPVTSRAEARLANPSAPSVNLIKQLNDGNWDGTKYGLITLRDFIPFMDSAIFIVQMISLGFLTVLFLVVMIGIANTFRIIMYERITEIGTMRAFGWSRRHVKWLFLDEAVILSLLGSTTGFILGIIGMLIISRLQFDSNNSMAFFQTNGHWIWKLSFFGVFWKFLLVSILTLLAVRGIAKKAGELSPAQALRTTK